MNIPSLSRRSLMVSSLKSVAMISGLAIWGGALRGTFAWAQEKLELIDMSEKKRTDAANKQAVAIAKSFAYVEAADSKNRIGATALKSARGKEIKPDAQYCSNCTYYVKAKANDKGAPCQIIPAGGTIVHKNGWCKMFRPSDDA